MRKILFLFLFVLVTVTMQSCNFTPEVDSESSTPFFVFPNPAREIGILVPEGHYNALLQVFGSNGNEIFSHRMADNNRWSESVNISDMRVGNVYVTMKEKGKVYSTKILIYE